MSEKLKHQADHEATRSGEPEKIANGEYETNKTKEKTKSPEHHHKNNLEKIRESIESETKSEQRVSKESKPKQKNDSHRYVSKSLIDETYKRTLTKTRHKLSPPMRTFSKIVHNPVVDNVSEFTSKTVARPSGILAGGIIAFMGSSSILWTARHYGYEYNFLLFAVLFIGGFFIGLTIEAVIRLFLLKKK